MKLFLSSLVLLLIITNGLAAVVINEVMYNPINTEPGHQWIELYNNSDVGVNLQGWQILTAGISFIPVFTLPNIIIQPNGFILIGGEFVEGADIYTELQLPAGEQNTVGIRLTSTTGYTDTVLYGEPNINNLPDDITAPAFYFALTTPSGYSLARIADGYDTDNNAHDWFSCAIPTPGYSNNYLIDLSLEDLEVSDIGGRVRISVKVVNPSIFPIAHNEAHLRIVVNEELYGYHYLPELLPEYHSTEIIFLDDLVDGYYFLDIFLVYQFDPDLSNNHLSTTFLAGSSPLVLNELMFKQSAGNQEWVEIYNRSESSIIMDHFYLEDAAATRTNFSGVIPPKTYMVIVRNKQQFLDVFHYIDPDKVIESTSWAILNNDRETLFIADQYGYIFDYTEYTAPASYPHDVSLERINPYDDESEWDRSVHPNMSTPAAPNSLLPLQFDLAIIDSFYQEEDGSLLHNLVISNIGYNNINEFSLRCYAYYDEATEGILLYEDYFMFFQNDIISFQTEMPTAEYSTFRYIIEAVEDLDPSNNYSFSYYSNNALPVVINEIMFLPFVGDPRWIELKVNNFYKYLFKVTLETERYTVQVPLSNYEYIILVNDPADSLFIIQNYTIDDALIVTGLTTIYVSGEELTLYDPSGNIFENFTYDPDWSKTRGVSAERINPILPSTNDNWAHSINPNGATPGKQNSIFTPYIPTQTALSLSPNPFSPFRGERTIISFELPERLNRVNCRIFDLKGRLVNTIIDQEIFAAKGNMIWDGKREDGMTLPVGVYIILLEATGRDTEKIYRERSTVVIGR
ncbi:MAG: lamin tail domain-containing protein [Candidatus Cloacimonetes bacterium]|nr:lamin tail domain-containing protein [Candidatus Cloacimonadota bacterium]